MADGRRALVLIAFLLTMVAGACGPASTPEPTIAPTGTPTADLNVLYEDSFSDSSSGWPIEPGSATQAGYHPPEAYRLEVATSETLATAFRAQAFGNFSAELRVMTETDPAQGRWRYGMAFHRISPGNYYAFLIDPVARGWQVLKREGDVWQTLAEGTDETILVEAQAINVLRVDTNGPNMAFAINGRPAVQVHDTAFPAGDFGLVAETLDASQANILFDLLTVRRSDSVEALVAPTPAFSATPLSSETPVPTVTSTPRPGRPAVPTVPPLTAISGTATALAATAGAVLTGLPTCGLPGLPPCP